MRNILFIIIFIIVFLLIKSLPANLLFHEMSTLLVGIMLLTSYLFADLIRKMRLPKLTGYMLMGVILGTTGIGFLTSDIMDDLQFLENLALCFIALTAGGELKFNILKKIGKSIFLILSSQLIIIYFGMLIIFILISDFIPVLSELSNDLQIGLAILFAGTALSTSPATTIGIITEVTAHGKVTNIVLAVTVMKAIVLILFFPIILLCAKIFLFENSSYNISLIMEIFLHIIGSMGLGIMMGIIIIWYLSKVKVEVSIFLLAVALTITEISFLFGLEILLSAMIAGIIVQNFSQQGQGLIKGVEIFSLPIYVIFFCFAGASLHIDVLTEAITITLFIVFVRFLLNYLGNYTGAFLAKEDKFTKHFSWLGYIGQAGIAVGLGILIEQNLPNEIRNYFITVLISTVVINEMMGPVLLKYVFNKAGEAQVSN